MHPTQPTSKKKKQTPPNPSPAPPPYYLTSARPPAYCHTCGRVISSKRNAASKPEETQATAPKFCSDRCKRHKPSSSPSSAEAHVERALIALLSGLPPPPPYKSAGAEQTKPAVHAAEKKKGEKRVLLPMSILEAAVFGPRTDPERGYGRRRNRAFRGVREDGEWRSVDMEDSEDGADGARMEPISSWEAGDFEDEEFDIDGDGGVSLGRADGSRANEGGEEGGSMPETPEMEARRRAGQKRAEEREFARCVVRRAVVFGVEVEGWEDVSGSGGGGKKSKKGRAKGDIEDEELESETKTKRRKCEAVMSGHIVEPSFAKGDWSVRWRDE
ncbi:hypothetical protein WHR41_05769 [Cladosporium halotolerans]|uniref:Uncharacterized protein n=1 Tax=Cladosporium halotolerans TaxID=1052096 RepID=A0AB34KNG9_9PEZI